MNVDQYARQHEKEQIEKLRKQVRVLFSCKYRLGSPARIPRLRRRRLSSCVSSAAALGKLLTFPVPFLQEQLQKEHDELHAGAPKSQ